MNSGLLLVLPECQECLLSALPLPQTLCLGQQQRYHAIQ